MDASASSAPASGASAGPSNAGDQRRLPKLERLDPSKAHDFIQPIKFIFNSCGVTDFRTSEAYRDIGLFLMQLNRAMCPRKAAPAAHAAAAAPLSPSPPPPPTGASTAVAAPATAGAPAQGIGGGVKTFPLGAPRDADPESVRKLRSLLETADYMVAAIPASEEPRRFGNISFRRWYENLQDRADALLREHLPAEVLTFGVAQAVAEARAGEGSAANAGAGPLVELKAYFLGAFGSPQRLDYGTGHELSFLAFLTCLWKLGAFKDGGISDDDASRSIVLGVVEPYLRVVRHLILKYTLEPAGSHGVWGLDDHSFLPYIFGSAQLTRAISDDASAQEPMPLEGSIPDAPSPSSVTDANLVAELCETNMYFSAVHFIHQVKKGPFWEHSPMLFDISGIQHGWGKINKGMLKMYDAEVLNKFPVVQHIHFGMLLLWKMNPDVTPLMPRDPEDKQRGASPPSPGSSSTRSAPSVSGRGVIPHNDGRPPRLPDAGPIPLLDELPRGQPGTASAQFSITRAPWATD